MNKILILYYSYEGNTEKIAKDLATNFNLKIEKIKPLKEKTTNGFSKYLWGGSQVIFKKRPKLESLKSPLNEFDTIIFATPIWAGEITPALYSFIEKNDISNKNIALFYTHKGGHKNAIYKFKKALDESTNVISICDCFNVEKDYKNQKEKLFNWYKLNISKEIK